MWSQGALPPSRAGVCYNETIASVGTRVTRIRLVTQVFSWQGFDINMGLGPCPPPARNPALLTAVIRVVHS